MSFAAAEAFCMALLLLLWTVGCACGLGVVAVHVGLNSELWSSHKRSLPGKWV